MAINTDHGINALTASSGNITVNGSVPQPELVSGTNIKTINSASMLGSGNITTGDVTGQASSVDGEIALFSGTGGKTVKRATGSGLAKLTSGVLSTASAGTDYVTPSGTETLTNKTLSGAILNDGYTEEIYALSGTTPALSPTNGSIQTWTLSGNSTPTAGTWAGGQSMILGIDDGAAYTITWPTITWTTTPSVAPTLPTSGYLWVVLWKVGSTLYGKY